MLYSVEFIAIEVLDTPKLSTVESLGVQKVGGGVVSGGYSFVGDGDSESSARDTRRARRGASAKRQVNVNPEPRPSPSLSPPPSVP